ncbi:glycosyltransferase family 1 protein [Hymenobacter daecheongensis]|uniref:glycosyltransferase family 1 protein n=1 Tax=Hymenobacter daecheongensis TaxID=496053 RepID=UPI0011612B39|nr:glycosyltransferase family 1 protein [Hymenobacter daecheongensis]
MCATPADWEAALRRLLADNVLRTRLGTAARHTVQARYSVVSNWPNFRALFS